MLAAGGLVLAALAAYLNSFAVPFVFDDVPAIVENSTIRRLWPLSDVLVPQLTGGVTVSGRPVVNLSLAVNYAISGTDVWSYHAVNLGIHLAAGLLLFGFVRRTLLTPVQRERFGAAAPPLAFSIAAIWMLHPLQTESVTYVVQRAESLAGFFYLATLYAFVRATDCYPLVDKTPTPSTSKQSDSSQLLVDNRIRRERGLWLGVSFVACLLGMATKEVMASAPLLLLLYDRTFLAGSFRGAWQARGKFHLALAATWLLLGALVLGTGGRGGTAGFGTTVSAWSYALTQCRAIVRYLGLSLWPQPLIFDYGLATARDLAAVWPQAVIVVVLLATTVVLLARRPVAGFLGAGFFALLAPSSSFVPVVTQTIAEHRMYLPLAAIVTLVVLASHRWWRAATPWLWGGVALVLAAVTTIRNADYRTEESLWADTAAKLPTNARAHNNLGQAQFRAGRVADAMQSYERALALQPNYPETHYNLGVALAQRGEVAAAIAHYETALRLQPGYPEAHNNLGNAFIRTGRVPEAVGHFEAALRLKPDFAEAHSNLGNALLQSDRPADAAASLQRALEFKPHYPEARYNLGNALAAAGRMADALQNYQEAIRLKPDYAEPHINAGNALLQLDRVPEAVAHYEAGLRLNPSSAEGHNNLGTVFLHTGRPGDALKHFEQALAARPDFAEAQRNLAEAQAELGAPLRAR